MTKAEERKVLAQIVALIDSTPADSYIRMAFLNVPNYAERNIADDAGYNPVAERDMWERRAYEKDCQLQKLNAEMGEKLLRLEHENQALSTHLDEKDEEIRKLGHLYDSKVAECAEIVEQRDALSDCVDGHNEITEKQDRIIRQMLNKGFAKEETGCGDERYGYCYAVTEMAEAFGVKGEEIRTIRESIRAMAESDESVVERIADMKVEGVWNNG